MGINGEGTVDPFLTKKEVARKKEEEKGHLTSEKDG
jgi:hypothetical protein